MQVENTPLLARKNSKTLEDDLVSSFSDCTSGLCPMFNIFAPYSGFEGLLLV